MVAVTGGGLDLLPSLRAGWWGAQVGSRAEPGLTLTSMAICCDLALILKLLTCFVLLNASFLREETSKLVKCILVLFVHQNSPFI